MSTVYFKHGGGYSVSCLRNSIMVVLQEVAAGH